MAPRKFDRYMVQIGLGRHRKFVRFTDSERCAHVFGVLALAAQSPRRGYLLVADGHEVGPEEIANEAGGGVTVRVARSAMEKLKRVGILEHDDEADAWFVHDWWDINPDPRPDPTNAERQARHRARNGNRNGTNNAARNGAEGARVTRLVTAPEVEGEVKTPPTPQGGSRKRGRGIQRTDSARTPEDLPPSAREVWERQQRSERTGA